MLRVLPSVERRDLLEPTALIASAYPDQIVSGIELKAGHPRLRATVSSSFRSLNPKP
jgi:hypothetical protein